MSAAKSDDDNEVWGKLFSGPNADVWIHKRCRKEMQGLNAKDRAKIEATMSKMYCKAEQSAQISDERLNRNEGRYGRKNLLVQAFKSFQARVYGVEGSVFGTRAFFASVATVKKKDKANPQDLARAAERVETVTDHVPGANV